jgi:hypothetical protein
LGLAEWAHRPIFKSNELGIFKDKYDMNAFIETTRWFGMKLSLLAENRLNNLQTRNRTIYLAKRNLSPVLLREFPQGNNDVRLFVNVGGSF